jgi:hypothetical protein
MKLGKSQQAVVDLLKTVGGGPADAQFVGDNLYEKTSSCFAGKNAHNEGYGMGGSAGPAQIRRSWAAKLLNELKKKGLVEKRGKEWVLTGEGQK